MAMTTRKILTVVTEAALEDTLVREIEALGARGYTITDARGKGGRGIRDATWAPHANIRLEVLCDAATAETISAALRERYYDHYSMVLYVGDVEVLRPDKF
jgi:hypothetical protein